MTSRSARISTLIFNKYRKIIYSLLAIIILTPFIANDVPVICKTSDGLIIPIFQKSSYQALIIKHSENFSCNWSVKTPIPYHAQTIQSQDQLLPPFSGRHILGTDSLGRDVFAGLLYGLHTALIIALLSMFIAGLGGLCIGAIAGYFGDSLLMVSKRELISHLILAAMWIFIGSGLIKYIFPASFLFIIAFLVLWISMHFFLQKLFPKIGGRSISVPLDNIIMRSIEIYKSIPALFILLVLLGYIKQSNIYFIAVLIGILTIPNVARLVRGEVIKVKKHDFVTASTILNFKRSKILFQQILPNIVGPLTVALSFGAAGAILVESTLSFLGIGLALDEITWGSILTESRKYHTAWWLAIFPGLAILGLIVLFNKIGRYISELFQSDTSGL